MQEQRNTIFEESRRSDPFGPISTGVADGGLIPSPTPAPNETTRSTWKFFSFETLKGLFFFVPGAVLLALIGVVTMIIFADIVIFGRSFQELPETMFEQIAMLIFVGSITSLMVWFGIGRLNDRRHFALPLSVFATGVVIGAVGLIIEALIGTRGDFIEAFADNNLIIFLLPLLLVIPVLIREWLNLRPEND